MGYAYVTRIRLDVIFAIPLAINVLCRGVNPFCFIANMLVSSIMDMRNTEGGYNSNPMSGLSRFQEDIKSLPSRYKCLFRSNTPEHCTVNVDGVAIDIWLNDVSLYPNGHSARVEPAAMSDSLHSLPTILCDIQLCGEVSEMICTISSILSCAREDLKSWDDSGDEMTEVDTEIYDDDNYWNESWKDRRLVLLKENYNAVKDCENKLLQDVAYVDDCVDGLIWIKTPISDLKASQIFSEIEAETWGLCSDYSLWILFSIRESDDNFRVYVRQAHDDAKPRDILQNLVRRSQVLCVLEAYIRKTFLRFTNNTVPLVGSIILERLGGISKYCSVCGDKSVDIPSLTPFCCASQLCQYQYMYLDLNGELEHIVIKGPAVVDLLIQLAYIAAINNELLPYPDCLKGSDDDCIKDTREICKLINLLPGVDELVEFAKTTDGLQEALRIIDHRLLKLLRWIILSNTAHLKQLVRQEEMIVGLNKRWHQFKMTISNPTKEATFQRHKEKFNKKSLFAFHGTSLANFHSILRTGLNFDKVQHGRSYGNGIYHAYHSGTSIGYTANRYREYPRPLNRGNGALPTRWKNTKVYVKTMLSVNEIVFDESCFVSTQPHLVVNDPEKVQTRFLIFTARGKTFEDVTCDRVPEKPLEDAIYHAIPDKYQIYDASASFSAIYRSSSRTKRQDSLKIPKDIFPSSKKGTVHKKQKTMSKLELPSC